MKQSQENQEFSGMKRLPVLDSELLKTFVAIAESGSFNRAATLVFKTPSAVSMQMKRLEEVLNTTMFLREGRSISLTRDGESLLSYARRILQLQDEAVAKFICPTNEGTVRLGTPDDFALRLLPNILARFNHTHPKVQVEVHCEPSSTLIKRLEAKQLDMTLITLGHAFAPKMDTTMVFREPLVWMGLDEGDAFARRPLPLALSAGDCAWRSMALDALDKADIEHWVAYSSQHHAGQQAAVMADLAIAPLPANLGKPPYRVLGPKEGLPDLGDYEVALMRAPDANGQISFFGLSASKNKSWAVTKVAI